MMRRKIFEGFGESLKRLPHPASSSFFRSLPLKSGLILALGLLAVSFFWTTPAQAEGSGTLFPATYDPNGGRANLEWRNSKYGNLLFRRTLLRVYISRAGESILLGSSAVGVPANAVLGDTRVGDAVVYSPGQISGTPGNEVLSGTPWSCLNTRTNATQGVINSRAQELAGPDAVPAIANAYTPCVFTAPAPGIYGVAFYGPYGGNDDTDLPPGGSIPTPDITNQQGTSTAMWDVTVRGNANDVATTLNGRVFSYYLTLYTGSNARGQNNTSRLLYSSVYVATLDGYQYRVSLRGLDPNGFVLYSNQVGFYDSDGKTPLYHDVQALPNTSFQEQNQLIGVQGNVSLAPPAYPVFFSSPDPVVLDNLPRPIPRAPLEPQIGNPAFFGAQGGDVTYVGRGGVFRFDTNVPGVYEFVISRDGVNFDPTNPLNRVLRGVVTGTPGVVQSVAVRWDGRDNRGAPYPVGSGYGVTMSLHAGEIHFPLLDAENNVVGGPTIRLTNPPRSIANPAVILPCYPLASCTGAFYDDRGYTTLGGTTVGTPGQVLCGLNPPTRSSAVLQPTDTTSGDRAFGVTDRALSNPAALCTLANPNIGGFGDKKGLDLWTFFRSNELRIPFRIIEEPPPPTSTPRPSATPVITPTETIEPTLAPTPTPEPPSPTPTDTGTLLSPPEAATATPLPGFPNTGRAPIRRDPEENALGWWLIAIGSLLLVSGLGAGRMISRIRSGRDRR